MVTIPPRFLDEIRARTTLSSVIGSRIRIVKAGREYKACCPFHGEKTPSFTINDDKRFYHCFGCGAHGDVIGFMIEHDKMSFPEAVETLATEAGLEMPKQSPKAQEQAKAEEISLKVMEASCEFFEQNLNKDALDYIKNRGILDETIKKFRIGLAPDDGRLLIENLKSKGFSEHQILDSGIARKGKKDGKPYAFFRDRIMFPVTDLKGTVIAFGGRILPENLRTPSFGNFDPPKYINSSDSSIFDKGRVLYGGNQAKIAARKGHNIIIVEGYMDAVSCHQAGFLGAVAPMGTALTVEQLSLAWSLCPSREAPCPILCLDGDEAGRRASVKTAIRIMPVLSPGRGIKIARLPDGQDPDNILQSSGKAGLVSVLSKASGILDILWEDQINQYETNSPEQRAGLKSRLLDIINTIENEDIAAHYRKALGDKISHEFFARKPRAKWNSKQNRQTKPIVKPKAKGEGLIKMLVLTAANSPEIYESVDEELAQLEIKSQPLNALRNSIISIIEENPEIDKESLKKSLRNEGHDKVIDDISCETVYRHAGLDNWKYLIKQLKNDAQTLEEQKKWHKAFNDGDLSMQETLRESITGNKDR